MFNVMYLVYPLTIPAGIGDSLEGKMFFREEVGANRQKPPAEPPQQKRGPQLGELGSGEKSSPWSSLNRLPQSYGRNHPKFLSPESYLLSKKYGSSRFNQS